MISLRANDINEGAIKLVSFVIVFLMVMLCAGISSINIESLMNGTQSGKSVVFAWGIVIISALTIVEFWISKKDNKCNLTVIDIFLFTFFIYILFRNNWSELKNSLLFLELTGLAILYFILRQQSTHNYFWIFIALNAGGLIQAVYGNLQLWDYYPSHHGLFKMTGSFFNPGPYAGYLAAVFPISLGFYLFNITIKFPKQNPLLIKLTFYLRLIKSFVQKNLLKSRFFYNKNKANSLGEEQKSSSRLAGNITMKSFFLISIISLCLVLPASRSRTAWLAVTVSSAYLISIKYNIFHKIWSYFNTSFKKSVLLFVLTFLLAIVGSGLYFFKPQSADGRLLIWKVSSGMIKDKPLLGYGYDGFKRKYMNYQAEYFKDNRDSEETMVAGDTNYAFNELIQITVEYGIIGMLPGLATILFIFFIKYRISESRETEEGDTYRMDIKQIRFSLKSEQSPTAQTDSNQILLDISRAVILSVLTFALFSYPLQILPIKVCLVAALAISVSILSKKKTQIYMSFHTPKHIRILVKSIASIGCTATLWLTVSHIQQVKTAYSEWKNGFDLYNYGIFDGCLTDYQKAYSILEANVDFLTNYGKALAMDEKYVSAVSILEQAAKYYPNIIVYTALGDTYKNLQNKHKAESAYIYAWQMNPSRFYPKYLLAKLYDENGEKEKAADIAYELLSQKVKIKSEAIHEIKAEMKRILYQYDNNTKMK